MRRRGECGLTLIELLLGLALLSLLTGFIAGGLVFARRAFLLDRTADLAAETDAAVVTLSDLMASAFPLKMEQQAGSSTVVYDGRSDSLSFIGLGTGHAMRGGLHLITIRVEDGELVAEVTPTRGDPKNTGDVGARRVPLLAEIKRVRFGFFGSLNTKAAPTWRNEWSNAQALPLQISCDFGFGDDRRPSLTLIVTLRQRE